MCVLPGQSVPVATRGVFTLTSTAYDGSLTVGGGVKLSTTSGKLTGCTVTDTAKVGLVIATGSRVAATAADQFAGAAGSTGTYAIIGLGL
jgi:hypothetical protein